MRRGFAVRGIAASIFLAVLVVSATSFGDPRAASGDDEPSATRVDSLGDLPSLDVPSMAELRAEWIADASGTRRGLKTSPAVQPFLERVYVPNEMSNSVSVIDPATFRVIATIKVGSHPQHVAPDWDMQRLYVNDTGLTEIDPRSGQVSRIVPVPMPYNLYFTAIVVAEDLDRLDFYDRTTWTFIRSVRIPWKGIDHLDFSLDGSYLLATTEYAGRVVKVDTRSYELAGVVEIGGLPIDVRLSPDGSVFYVTNQGRHGVSVIDPVAMKEVAFISTGRGAHGLQLTRDGRLLYVSNRLAGTISVIEVESRRVIANWVVGGSPDMLQLSPDGRQLWTGNRHANNVTVVDTATGTVLARIAVERAPHGLTYFPQPGRYSIGHNGMYR